MTCKICGKEIGKVSHLEFWDGTTVHYECWANLSEKEQEDFLAQLPPPSPPEETPPMES
jgi:hypothetical protein